MAHIRYTTSHPADMDHEPDRMRMADVDKLMPYLHLPVQSGSGRGAEGHEPQPYGRQLSAIARTVPRRPPRSCTVSGDFIVGFPGETDADFDDTLSACERGWLCTGLQLQILTPARYARRVDGRAAAARCHGRSIAAACRPRSNRDQHAFNRAPPWASTCEVLVERKGRAGWPMARQIALAAIGDGSRDDVLRSAISCAVRTGTEGGPEFTERAAIVQQQW